MGTSTSSSGPGAGVSFDPPWLDQLNNAKPDNGTTVSGESNDDTAEGNTATDKPTTIEKPIGLAPSRRFQSARRELGKYARTGDKDSFRRAVGHYSRTGMGGAKNVASRMRASTRSAAGLMSFLQATRERSDIRINQWIDSLAARNPTAQEVIDEIIQQVTTDGGSRDEESCRDSMNRALAELLEIQPDLDLLKMNDDDIWTVVELFLGNEACNRLHNDIGQLFESAKLSPKEVVSRIYDMREYLKSEVSAQIRLLRETGANSNSNQLESLMQEALKNTFLVYEGAL